MKISVIQMDMKLAAPEENFQHAEKLIHQAAENNPDVIVLPETWNTGFFPKEHLAELSDQDGVRTKALCGGLAKELNVNIVAGSVSNVKGGKVYNTALIFDRKGECIGEYDKIHGFSPSGEDTAYQGGDHRETFYLDGHKCGIIICYDVRFPELTRNLALDGIEILFVPAQWPNIRTFHWVTLNTARAIENQMFVVTCNSVGTAGKTVCGGNSRIFDPWGETIASAGITENIMSGDIDFSVIEKIRHDINVFRDRNTDIDKVL